MSRGDKKHTRRVENEAELLAALEPLGFEAIDPGALSPAEQVRAFAEAECIVGPHGAGLTNLAFASAGAPSWRSSPATTSTSASGRWPPRCEGLRYRYLVGDGSPAPSRRNRGVASDIRVDPRQVLQLLDGLVG